MHYKGNERTTGPTRKNRKGKKERNKIVNEANKHTESSIDQREGYHNTRTKFKGVIAKKNKLIRLAN